MKLRARLAVLMISISGLAMAEDVSPWREAVSQETLQREEKNLWAEAEAFDKILERSGRVRKDDALDAYLQGILNKLYPEFADTVRIRALNASQLNAFALPNGSMYINTGLLARLQNEAQLATVLAHEGAHFVHRHSFQQSEYIKNVALLATIVSLAGVPIVGNAVALTAMSGYSREHESEADDIGFKRLVAAGYSASEAPKTFEHLIAEIKALEIDEPFFFASHPKLQDRVETLSGLSKGAANGYVGHEAYVLAMRDVRIYVLQEDLDAYRYKQLILVLSDASRRREYPPEASYFLGEAYRLRNEEEDPERAISEYTLSLEGAPEFAPAYRALGLMRWKRGEKAEAALLFRRYLELAPDAPDKEYVQAYLRNAGS